jgi:ribosomal protein L16 Arg81 hydroxylase
VDRYIRQKGARKKKRARSLPPYAAHIRLSREQVQSLGLHPPIGFERKRLARPNLWLGPGGSLTPLHYDSNDNLLCQCAGRKRLMLYPPSQIKWLYTRGYSPAWSRVPNPLEPDLESYPRFARARHVDVTLNPGEILYLPARWAHFAYNLDASLMVNYWTEQTTLQRLLKSLELRMRRTRKRLRNSEWER